MITNAAKNRLNVFIIFTALSVDFFRLQMLCFNISEYASQFLICPPISLEPSEFEKYESQLLKLMSSPDDYYAYKGMKTTFEKQLKSSKKANKKSKRKLEELYIRGT